MAEEEKSSDGSMLYANYVGNKTGLEGLDKARIAEIIKEATKNTGYAAK
jgi:hypothetical protein